LVEGGTPLLAVKDLFAGYGKKQVLNGVSVSVFPGEIVALIGHNGAGKSTLLKTVFGMLPLWTGEIALGGAPIERPNPQILRRAGVSYAPQGHQIFPDLTVAENLELGGIMLSDDGRLRSGIDRSLELFPDLKLELERLAGDLSSGQRQMLSLATAMVTSPRILLLDEPSLGLAQPLVKKTLQYVQLISQSFGIACLVVEQKVREILNVANRVYVLRNGSVSFSGRSETLGDDAKLREVYL
jgi:branched-chain amino acid transport system ATP-binding protein